MRGHDSHSSRADDRARRRRSAVAVQLPTERHGPYSRRSGASTSDPSDRPGPPQRPPCAGKARGGQRRGGAGRVRTSSAGSARAPPLRPEGALPDDLAATGHVVIDFGDDRLTAGRPHPVIDPTLRLDRLAATADETAVVLLDVVLGYAADPDPTASLAPALERLHSQPAARDVAVVVSLCRTTGDPHGLERQAAAFRHVGAAVLLSNAAAARHAAALVAGGVTRRRDRSPACSARSRGSLPSASTCSPRRWRARRCRSRRWTGARRTPAPTARSPG